MLLQGYILNNMGYHASSVKHFEKCYPNGLELNGLDNKYAGVNQYVWGISASCVREFLERVDHCLSAEGRLKQEQLYAEYRDSKTHYHNSTRAGVAIVGQLFSDKYLIPGVFAYWTADPKEALTAKIPSLSLIQAAHINAYADQILHS